MGVVNATPDSFYAASRVSGVGAAVDAVAEMIEAGAAIIDVGGESTRPGSEYVGAEDEAARVVPVVEAVRARWDVAVSVDTRKALVAEAALDAGADIVNDVAAWATTPAWPPSAPPAAFPSY
jgi:dihydropteroate synthase